MMLKNINRWQAFGLHIGISLLIFFALLYMILVHWYPDGYFASDGGWQGIRIIFGVDVCLGPLLTLIVFKQGKPGLKFDMSVIAALQAIALTIGTHIVYSEHPVAVIWADNSFHPVSAELLRDAGLRVADLRRYGENSPVLIYFDMPSDPVREQAVRKEALRKAQPVYLNSAYFRPITRDKLARLVNSALDMDAYLRDKPEEFAKYREARERLHKDAHDLAFMPVHSRYRWYIGVLDESSLRMVDMLDIKPPA